MDCKRLLLVASALVLTCGLGQAARAETYSYRQYYSGWYQHPQKSYHYRLYYYKPTPTYAGYKYHYVVYAPKYGNYYYYYNPYSKQYWGRCPISSNGQPVYMLLKEVDRKDDLAKIPETAFPQGGDLPEIPEAKDGAKLDLPPSDLPPVDGLPVN